MLDAWERDSDESDDGFAVDAAPPAPAQPAVPETASSSTRRRPRPCRRRRPSPHRRRRRRRPRPSPRARRGAGRRYGVRARSRPRRVCQFFLHGTCRFGGAVPRNTSGPPVLISPGLPRWARASIDTNPRGPGTKLAAAAKKAASKEPTSLGLCPPEQAQKPLARAHLLWKSSRAGRARRRRGRCRGGC